MLSYDVRKVLIKSILKTFDIFNTVITPKNFA